MVALSTDDISLSGAPNGHLRLLGERIEWLRDWDKLTEYAAAPWSDHPPASVIDTLGSVGWYDLRQAHKHTLTLARLAAHATARAARAGRDVTSFSDFLQEVLDTYDVLLDERIVGHPTDALDENPGLPPKEGFAPDRVEPRDLSGHGLGEGAPLAQDNGQFVAVDHDPPADVVGHAAPPASRGSRLPLWCCPRCGSCIGLIGRFFQAAGVPLHTCRRSAA